MLRRLSLLSATVLMSACAVEPYDPPEPPHEMLEALARDLGQSELEIERRLAVEAAAAERAPALRAELGAAYGGAWLSGDGSRMFVGITDPALADAVRAAGAEPRLVDRPLAALEAALARAPAVVDPSVHAWYVDVADNRVVIVADDPASPAARALAAALGVEADAVRIEAGAERPRPFYDIRGGDELILGGTILCSVGFSVHGGFVTAGHCGGVNTPTYGSNWVAQGTVRGSVFPGSDHAWVEINGSWTSLPEVGNHAGGAVAVAGSQVAVVGSSVCRSGRTTGWRCGVIEGHGVTINYADGPVYGATRTSACAQGGDSGGSFISGNQAQGVTSGGSGNCTTGGTTFYQPVNPILAHYGLTLKTTGGGGAKEIVSVYNGKCIDVPYSNFSDGVKLHMWGCNGTAAQRWTFEGGQIRAGGKCMDVAWGSTANGAEIQIANCSGHLAQKFVLSAAGDLVSVLASKCVDIKDWNPDHGARLQIWDCAGTANQKWFTR